MGSERRVTKRRHLIYYLRVWDVASGDLIGHLADVTTEGFMLVSDHPLPLQRRYRLEIQWQDEMGEERSLRFDAESRWCRNDVNPALYDVGFCILEEDPAILNPLRFIIEDLGFND